MYIVRIRRLLKLLRALQGGRRYDLESLARACDEVSPRTIRRDLELLREVGVPVQTDSKNHKYYISGEHYLRPTNFTTEEALTLLALANDMANPEQLPSLEAARSAGMKLASTLPARLREKLQLSGNVLRIRIQPTSDVDIVRSLFDDLVETTTSRRAVRISYDSFFEREVISTKLHPYQILFSRRSWYVIGRSSLHREVRTFNLRRITKLEPLDERYSLAKDFSLENYLGNAWHLIPEPGKDREVVIRFAPQVAGNVAEVQWHQTQKTISNDDGTLDFHVTVSGLREITWWILGYGDQAEVIEPPELRQNIARHAARLAQLYQREIDDVPLD